MRVRVGDPVPTLMTLSMGPTQCTANFLSLTSLAATVEGQYESASGNISCYFVTQVKE